MRQITHKHPYIERLERLLYDARVTKSALADATGHVNRPAWISEHLRRISSGQATTSEVRTVVDAALKLCLGSDDTEACALARRQLEHDAFKVEFNLGWK